ncbi:iron-sulfur cluster assembly scaffold protein [soil metagenome]
MAEVLYTIDILRLAASTGDWPPLIQPDASAERRSPTCGSRVRVDVACAPDGRVAAVGVQVGACALGQAATAIMAAQAPGRSLEDFRMVRDGLAAYLKGEREALPDWPGMAPLAPARAYPARHASILLAFDATLAALDSAARQPGRAHG